MDVSDNYIISGTSTTSSFWSSGAMGINIYTVYKPDGGEIHEIKNEYEGNMNNTKIRVTISQLLSDLNNGITRCKSDTGYDEKRGSVEEKYGLTKEAVKEIFRHPKLANLRVRIPTTEEKIYELVDDVEDKKPEDVANDNKPKFGEKSASQTDRLEKKEEIKTVSVHEIEKEAAKSEETSF